MQGKHTNSKDYAMLFAKINSVLAGVLSSSLHLSIWIPTIFITCLFYKVIFKENKKRTNSMNTIVPIGTDYKRHVDVITVIFPFLCPVGNQYIQSGHFMFVRRRKTPGYSLKEFVHKNTVQIKLWRWQYTAYVIAWGKYSLWNHCLFWTL